MAPHPRSGSGPDEPANLITLCPTCHASRHTNMLGHLARRTIERWAVRLARLLQPALPGGNGRNWRGPASVRDRPA
ncbi:MAG: hypothetical protein GEU75_04015 [Dehalococcoidia bacterium]|nr:hypothetical protein [Dehalococcoidia bacterium]